MKTKKDRAWTPLQNTDPQKTPVQSLTVKNPPQRSPQRIHTTTAGQQLQAAALQLNNSQTSIDWPAIAKVRSDWQKCLDFAGWLEVMEAIVLDIAQGGAIQTGQFTAIERANTVLAEAMVWVTSEAKQLELA